MTEKKKPKLTDAERHKRFLDVARKVEAPDDREAFDRAFDKVVKPIPRNGDSKIYIVGANPTLINTLTSWIDVLSFISSKR